MSDSSQLSVLEQINDLELFANRDATTERFAYDQGFLHGRQSFFEELGAELSSQIETAKTAAELYQNAAKSLVPEVGEFLDLRVGMSHTMGGLGVLAIIPASQADLLKRLRKVARLVERHITDRENVDVFICNIAADTADRDRIAYDFPIYRTA